MDDPVTSEVQMIRLKLYFDLKAMVDATSIPNLSYARPNATLPSGPVSPALFVSLYLFVILSLSHINSPAHHLRMDAIPEI